MGVNFSMGQEPIELAGHLHRYSTPQRPIIQQATEAERLSAGE